jgi:hypothetical protein
MNPEQKYKFNQKVNAILQKFDPQKGDLNHQLHDSVVNDLGVFFNETIDYPIFVKVNSKEIEIYNSKQLKYYYNINKDTRFIYNINKKNAYHIISQAIDFIEKQDIF